MIMIRSGQEVVVQMASSVGEPLFQTPMSSLQPIVWNGSYHYHSSYKSINGGGGRVRIVIREKNGIMWEKFPN